MEDGIVILRSHASTGTANAATVATVTLQVPALQYDFADHRIDGRPHQAGVATLKGPNRRYAQRANRNPNGTSSRARHEASLWSAPG